MYQVEHEPQQPRMMTIRQIAKTGLLPENAIRTMVKTGQAPYILVGSRVMINYDKFIEQLNAL